MSNSMKTLNGYEIVDAQARTNISQLQTTTNQLSEEMVSLSSQINNLQGLLVDGNEVEY